MAPNPRRQDAKLDALYEELPRISCRGLCPDSCGPIGSSLRERLRVEQTARKPLTCGAGATCSMLTEDGKCGVYDIRPLVCRLWGVIESMPCPYGCKPERYLTDAEGYDLLRRAAEIGEEDGERIAEMIRALQQAGAIEQASQFLERPTLEGRYGALPRTVIER